MYSVSGYKRKLPNALCNKSTHAVCWSWPHDFKTTLKSGLGSPPVSLVAHGIGDLDEACDVTARHQARQFTLLRLDVLLGGLQAILERLLHNRLELAVDLFGGPRCALQVHG